MKKTFLALSILAALPIFSFNCTSCFTKPNVPIPEENDPHVEYIKDRTFSIASVGTTPQGQTAWVRGTGWIINKNSSSDSQYEYWMATNMHVTYDIFGYDPNFIPQRMLYSFCSGSEDYISGIKQYRSFNISSQSPSKTNDVILDPNHEFFSYETPANKLNSIDFSVLKVDFTNYVSNDNSLKQKLDKLNDWYVKHNNTINEFASSKCPNVVKNVYCAGYPASSKGGTNWSKVNFSSVEYISEYQHQIPSERTREFLSRSPDYIYTTGVINGDQEKYYPLQGGASGSMLLSDDYKVLGIYWGGGLGTNDITKQPIFFPCFNIFNSTKANFIQYYII